MAVSVDLGPALEQATNDLVRTGRYGSKSEVLREGVRLVQEREAKLQKLHEELEKGLEDMRAGRVRPADDVFDELEARLHAIVRAAE